jgi:membrane-bound lytic murein transglycosylase B
MPSRHSNLLVAVPLALIVAVVGVTIVFAPKPAPMPLATPTPEPTYAAPAAPPVSAPAASPGAELVEAPNNIVGLVDEVWLISTAASTGIPERALAAYAGAALWKSRQMPTCGISWNTLAAIGHVESKHGTYGGASIAADGTISPAIYGVALDGGSTAHIPDSDDGKFDKDKKYDRAVGPMQMIPQSWRNWRTDANNDHTRDPQNMFDAVMAAANYLCRASDDMVGVTGWQAGIASYNSAPSYLHAVARAAIDYAG